MSYRREPLSVDEHLADMRERLRRLDSRLATLPANLFVANPLFRSDLPTGSAKGDILVWDVAGKRWMILPRGTVGQHLEVDPTTASGLRWVT